MLDAPYGTKVQAPLRSLRVLHELCGLLLITGDACIVPTLHMSNLAETLERFRRGPEFLAMVLTGVYADEMDFTLAPGKWSIRQIVAHVADSELVGAQRFRQTGQRRGRTCPAQC